MPSKALLRRIKRRIIGRDQKFMVATPPGFETLCKNEIHAMSLSLSSAAAVPGGVTVTGRLTDCYRMNLHLRIANRILMRVAQFKATNFRELDRRLAAIPWELFLFKRPMPQIRVTTRQSRLYHTAAVKMHLAERIAAQHTVMIAADGSQAMGSAPQIIFVRIINDTVQISIDSSGLLLHKRGLKPNVGRAPIRETLAAGALTLAGFTGTGVLLDPMCGSGTFTLEAAMLAQHIPAGRFRNFAFMNWPSFRPRQWAYLKRTARQQEIHVGQPQIFASDDNRAATDALRTTTAARGWQALIQIDTGNFLDLKPHTITATPGTVVLNPPYGLRLGNRNESRRLFEAICRKLLSDFKGWRTVLIAPTRALARKTGLRLVQRRIRHGGTQRPLLTGVI